MMNARPVSLLPRFGGGGVPACSFRACLLGCQRAWRTRGLSSDATLTRPTGLQAIQEIRMFLIPVLSLKCKGGKSKDTGSSIKDVEDDR